MLAYTSSVLDSDVLRQCGLDGVWRSSCDERHRWCSHRGNNDFGTGAFTGSDC